MSDEEREKVLQEMEQMMRLIQPHMTDASHHMKQAMESWVRMPTKDNPLTLEERAKALAMICTAGEVVVRAMANGSALTTTLISTLPLLALAKHGNEKEKELSTLLLEELGKVLTGSRYVPPVMRNNPHTRGKSVPVTRRFGRRR